MSMYVPCHMIFDRVQHQGPFGVDRMSLWTFWTGSNMAKY